MRRSIGIVIGLIALGLVGWIVYLQLAPEPHQQPRVVDFASCLAAGRTATNTSPRRCDGPDGTTYTEATTSGNDGAREPSVREFTSLKGVTIKLDNWTDEQVVTSPTVITGQAPGTWSFEASFPVSLSDSAGAQLVQAKATLKGDWMTSDYVAFTVDLVFPVPATTTGVLTLRKDNPSGLPENDDAIEIPIRFSVAK